MNENSPVNINWNLHELGDVVESMDRHITITIDQVSAGGREHLSSVIV
jgi:hypothetical protein